MDIKKIVPPKLRRNLMLAFSWIPDKMMLPFQYWLILHRWPNLRQAKRFSEKIQVYKSVYHNEEMLECVDKYKVRFYVGKKLKTEKYLNKLYQVCDDANEINFQELPNRFVIKTTDGGNGDNILVVKDKSKLDIGDAITKINGWKSRKIDKYSREWAYIGARGSKIIVEQYLEEPENQDGSINDYKFLCYNGEFRYLWIDKNRYSNHKRGFWNENLEFLKGVRSDHPTFDVAPKLPENINEMIIVAESLAKGFPFVRVDLYNIEGHIYFGEMTFYPWSGYVQFFPDSFDEELGKYFDLSTLKG